MRIFVEMTKYHQLETNLMFSKNLELRILVRGKLLLRKKCNFHLRLSEQTLEVLYVNRTKWVENIFWNPFHYFFYIILFDYSCRKFIDFFYFNAPSKNCLNPLCKASKCCKGGIRVAYYMLCRILIWCTKCYRLFSITIFFSYTL